MPGGVSWAGLGMGTDTVPSGQFTVLKASVTPQNPPFSSDTPGSSHTARARGQWDTGTRWDIGMGSGWLFPWHSPAVGGHIHPQASVPRGNPVPALLWAALGDELWFAESFGVRRGFLTHLLISSAALSLEAVFPHWQAQPFPSLSPSQSRSSP